MKKEENCKHCGEQYIPKRYGAQKFCSNSCRSRYWYLKQNFAVTKLEKPVLPTVVEKKAKVEEMSVAGFGNAFFGSLAANATTELVKKGFAPRKVISEENKIDQRYIPVLNLPIRPDGSKPFFDILKKHLIYVPDPNYHNPSDYII